MTKSCGYDNNDCNEVRACWLRFISHAGLGKRINRPICAERIGSLILIERPNPGLRADQSVDALAKAPQAAFLAAPRASAAVGAERSGHRRRYLPC